MKKGMLFAIVALLLCVTAARAQKAEISYFEDYRWHGVKLFGHDYVHLGVATEVQGIDVSAVSHVGENHDDVEYWDTVLGYKLPVDGLNVSGGYGYLLLPGMDAQEMSLTIGLPGTISPRYTISHVVPDNAANGQIHTLGFDVFLGDDPNAITADLMMEITYNDGVNPFGGAVIRDFTHITVGAILKIPMQGFTLCPQVYYQHTFEEKIEIDKNVCWYGIGMQYEF